VPGCVERATDDQRARISSLDLIGAFSQLAYIHEKADRAES
jgi:hypothetical protein